MCGRKGTSGFFKIKLDLWRYKVVFVGADLILVLNYLWLNVHVLACGLRVIIVSAGSLLYADECFSTCGSSVLVHGLSIKPQGDECAFLQMWSYQVFSYTISSRFCLLYAFPKWCKPSLDDSRKCMYFVPMVVFFETIYPTDCPAWCEPSSDGVWIVMFGFWSHNLDYGWLIYGFGNYNSDCTEYFGEWGFDYSRFRSYFGCSWYLYRDKGSLVLGIDMVGVFYEDWILHIGNILMAKGRLLNTYGMILVLGSSTITFQFGLGTQLISKVNLAFLFSQDGTSLLDFSPVRMNFQFMYIFGLMMLLEWATFRLHQRYMSHVVNHYVSLKTYKFYYLEDLKANILVLVGVLNDSCALFSLPGVCPDGFYSGRFLRRQYHLVKCSMSFPNVLNLTLKMKITVIYFAIDLDPASKRKNIVIYYKHARDPVWHLDSGCSRSMTGVKQYLHKYVEEQGPKVVFGDNSSAPAEGYGLANCNGIVFTTIAYVNGLKYNLINASQLCDAKYLVQFDYKRGTIFNANKEVVLIAPRRDDVYVLNMSNLTQNGTCLFTKANKFLAPTVTTCAQLIKSSKH
ncbi:hypothetical protein CTI12_AA518900 [Artemisia annua]|uniref:Retrovirus-related Pol polyprotein from transposon TNT 1-94-like beta-barrel domain-containing protein n=1 Tax=Artemisia annua TaxID=35608 RepID=A0A2U1L8K0_ARTAN|nr:hypothetical protein CTI12_AA518900 [Artemisia annua]